MLHAQPHTSPDRRRNAAPMARAAILPRLAADGLGRAAVGGPDRRLPLRAHLPGGTPEPGLPPMQPPRPGTDPLIDPDLPTPGDPPIQPPQDPPAPPLQDPPAPSPHDLPPVIEPPEPSPVSDPPGDPLPGEPAEPPPAPPTIQ